ncbi:MAG: lipoprotein [Ramlibacter sp.]
MMKRIFLILLSGFWNGFYTAVAGGAMGAQYNLQMLNLQRMRSDRRPFVLAAIAGLFLAGCGQKGPLSMPTAPAAAGRATLAETLNPLAPAAVPAASSTLPPSAADTLSPAKTP